MGSAASVRKHPIHPMLIPFPIALWIFSFFADLIYVLGFGGAVWADLAFYTMAGGLIGALLAAVPGVIDYRSISDPHVKRIATWHMAVNVTVAVLFAVNLWLRIGQAPGTIFPVVLSTVGVLLLSISGWLGGELVYVYGIAVEDAPRAPVRRGRVA
jgi:uncharacterized membrane protein